MARFIATFFYVGLLRPAPGTWGSLAAVLAGIGLHWIGGIWALVAGLVVALALAIWSVRVMEAQGAHDPSYIVIDEVVGQWIALLPVSYGAVFTGSEITALWPGLVAAFVLFRLFDIWKPWLVGRAEARHTAWSVTEDDVWAGVFAAVGVMILAVLAHVPLML